MLPAGRSRRGQRADAFRRATPLMSDPFSARTTVRTTTCRAVSSPRSVARELALDEDLTRWRKSFLQRFAIHQFIKGSFQKKLEALLPPDIPVKVLKIGPTPAQVA